MKILALIPARGGSKRVPGKNIKPLGGLPLIGWTIRAALDSGVCADVVVSTDDPDIAQVARQFGAQVPGLRPAELSTDTASSVDVALHALEIHESRQGTVDGLLLMQPTSPFRSTESIRRSAVLFEESGFCHPVVSVSPATSHPSWCFRLTEKGMEPFLGWENVCQRSQDMERAWVLNGAIYLVSPSRLVNERNFLGHDVYPLAMENPWESIDIDTPADWAFAEAAIVAGFVMPKIDGSRIIVADSSNN